MPLIRPATEADYPGIVAILNAQLPQQTTLERFTQMQQSRSARRTYARLVAILPDGQLAGFAASGDDDDQKENHLFLTLRVAQEHRRQGAGTALLQAVAAWARSQGAVRLQCTVKDDQTDLLDWAGRRGLVEEGRLFRAELFLGTWKPDPFWPSVLAARARGFRFATLQEVGDGEENLRRLHQFCQQMERHVPGRAPLTPAFELWRLEISGSPAWDPTCVLLALDGDQWAGVSYMEQQADGSWYTRLSAVDPAYRGQGLGKALKVAAVQHALQQGVTSLSTYTHTNNGPMLAINRQLGYRPVFGLVQLYLPL